MDGETKHVLLEYLFILLGDSEAIRVFVCAGDRVTGGKVIFPHLG
jgi:hypothetical protein